MDDTVAALEKLVLALDFETQREAKSLVSTLGHEVRLLRYWPACYKGASSARGS